jgi:hypothetical protein
MSSSTELLAAVRAATTDTPYIVRETPRGFDLTIDVADARWLAPIRAHGLAKVFTYEVALDDAKKALTITDVSNTVSWSAGGGSPRLTASRRVQRGRILERSFRKEWGVDLRSGEATKVVDYSFSSSEGRDLIRDAAKAQGWSESMPGVQKGALWFGIGTIVAMVLLFGGLGVHALLS